jgi:hypothetical protein
MPPRLLLVVLAVPLAAAACGRSKHAAVAGGDPLTTVNTAFKKTFAAGRQSVNLKANAETSGQSLVLSGGGAFNTKSAAGPCDFTSTPARSQRRSTRSSSARWSTSSSAAL